MTKQYKYYVGCSDYFCENHTPDEVFNDRLVPYLETRGIEEKDIKEVYKMVCEIAESAWSNGSDNARAEMED